MNDTEKLNKVKSIIQSCVTYGQLQTCSSFVTKTDFFPDILDRVKVLGFLQSKVYEMRKNDLLEHAEKLKQIRLKYYGTEV